ncbi:MAG: prepilin-type N-terminal cleavage/methylation domain-containing protein [Sideroxydans sp.]|nr:prepilin-type N-terminal cleavage/methylation domain-containing protein [Sideroxydans sp.]
MGKISSQLTSKGFTLIEMIVVIVITGIIAGMVAIFIKAPVQGYIDSSRRAELTDIADTAMRRMSRDIRISVPNSVRPQGTGMKAIEFLPTKDGGRYRAAVDPAIVGSDALVFDGVDKTFEVIGGASAVVGDRIIMGSTDATAGLAYGAHLRGVSGVVGVGNVATSITLSSGLPVEAQLVSQRFDVIEGAVMFACEAAGGGACGNVGGNGSCELVRYAKYGVNAIYTYPPIGGQRAVLADKVSDCSINYELANQRFGLVMVNLEITSGGESVRLINEIHVSNAP